MTLTDFLLARIAEDEEQATMGDGWNKDALMEDVPVQFWDYGETHIGYRRFLAECEAKRGIVDIHQIANADQGGGVGCMHCDWDREWGMPTTGGCDTLRYLALPYADHPDYREEWKP